MATVFTPEVSAVQSVDAETLTIYDGSNWTDNTSGLVIGDFTREIVIRDSSGDIVQTIPFVGSALSVSKSILKDQFFKITLNITGAQNFTTFINVSLDRYSTNLRMRRLNCNCGAGCKIDPRLIPAEPYFEAAYDATLSGNGILFDKYIGAAYTWLGGTTN
jgi:hypothetical protein